MSTYGYRMLILQGYDRNDVIHNHNASLLARWTPFACGCFGAFGISLGSPAYLWALGVLTFIGAVSSRSFYDHIYQLLLRPIIGLGAMPRHGAPRRFGCGIGAALFLLSGTGFYLRSPMLSLIPGLKIPPPVEITGHRAVINLGAEKLRFMRPVRSGAQIHARMRLKGAERTENGTRVSWEIAIHVIGQRLPAVLFDMLVLLA